MLVEFKSDFGDILAGERLDVADPEVYPLLESGVAVRYTPPQHALLRAFEQTLDGLTDQAQRALGGSSKGARRLLFGAKGDGNPRHSFGDFCCAVKARNAKRLEYEYGCKAALGTNSGTAGGYTIPVEFMPGLLFAAYDSIVLSRALVLPMSSRSLQVPVLDHQAVPLSGNTAFSGGVVGFWNSEGLPIPESEPSFRETELVTHELIGYSKLPDALLEDMGAGIESLLYRVIGEALTWFQELAFLMGDGVGKPLGAVKGGAALAVNRHVAGSFDNVDAALMLSKLPPRWNPDTTCFVVHPTVLAKLLQIAATAGGGIQKFMYRGRPKLLLHNLPVETSEALPIMGNVRDVLLCDFSYYLVGDRQQVQLDYSNQGPGLFTNRMGLWRFVSHVDGQPWLGGPITLSDGGTQVSPFIYLN